MDSPSVDPDFITNGLTAQSMDKPTKNFYPLFFSKMQRKAMWIPFIFTCSASPFPPSNDIDPFARTAGTYFFRFHATKYIKFGG
jgi:hypothetical protein